MYNHQMSDEKIAIIIRGPAAVGKTTIAQALKEALPEYVLLSIDMFRHMISKESTAFRRTIARNVGEYFLKQVTENNLSVILEEVFHDDYHERLLSILHDKEYRILGIFINAPNDVLLSRNRNRSKVKSEEIILRFADQSKAKDGELVIDANRYSVVEIVAQIIVKVGDLRLSS